MTKALAVYIHWPFCKSKCPYCDFNSHVREAVEQQRWQKALLTELGYMAKKVPDHAVVSIFFGGGTPSLMPAETVSALIERVKTLWPTDKNTEITLEANPTSVEAEKFEAFAKAGVNRVSIGVQSLRQKELSFLGREHNVGEAKKAINLAAKIFPRYSFDLIYARPGQSVNEWEDELGEALAMTRGHLSLYQLTIEENTAFAHAYKKGEFALPDEEEAEALYRATERLAGAGGLKAYEISNYAAPGDESRHNLAYWLGTDYVGVGPGAHGRVSIDGMRTATQALKSPERWLEGVEKNGQAMEVWQFVPPDQEIEERVMMGLRLSAGIDAQTFKTQTGKDLGDCINAKKRAHYIAEGLLTDDTSKLQPTLKGRLVLNRLTAELLS